jgi:hypothetical protein
VISVLMIRLFFKLKSSGIGNTVDFKHTYQ